MSKAKKNYLHLGAYLRAKRKDAGLSQEDAARALGYTERFFLSRIENQRVALPLDKIPAISELYCIPIEEIAEAVIDEQTKILSKRIENIVMEAKSCI